MIGIDTVDRLLTGLVIAVALALASWFGLHHYGAERYNDGYSAAVAVGQKQHDKDAAAARQTETDLRQTLAKKDAVAHQKEVEYAENLADAQRRVRTGVDRLRCPASTVQPTAPTSDRPASAGPGADGTGPVIVPEVAGTILSNAAAVAGLVRRYEQVVERFEACRAVNAK
jgi:hypothetical protein